MHWQKACELSPLGVAVRLDSNRHMILRGKDGNACSTNKGDIKKVENKHIEGYEDWYPMEIE